MVLEEARKEHQQVSPWKSKQKQKDVRNFFRLMRNEEVWCLNLRTVVLIFLFLVNLRIWWQRWILSLSLIFSKDYSLKFWLILFLFGFLISLDLENERSINHLSCGLFGTFCTLYLSSHILTRRLFGYCYFIRLQWLGKLKCFDYTCF